MTVFVPESIKVLGSDAGGNSVVLCEMFVDDLANLPAPDAYTGYKLSMGCTATVINDNSRHRINSAGQWVQIAAGTATYTRAEIDSMIARIDATEEDDRAALVQQVDSGAKNLLEMTSTITTITRYGVTATYDKAAGTVILTGTHVDGTSSAIFEFYSGNAVEQKIIPAGVYRLSGCPSGGSTSTFRGILTQIAGGVDTGNGATFTLTEPHYIAYRILISGNCDFSAGVVFRPMICTASDYAISQAFVPYAPTNRQLYELIKQYHP